MRIRLGYVANALRLPDSSPSHTITATNLSRLPAGAARTERLETIARLNLANTLRILRANAADGIPLYRLTSKLVPLATHPIAGGWPYWKILAPELAAVGEFARANGLRLSAHPDHFTLLNSPRPEVTEAAIRDLEYHDRLLAGMGLPDARLIIHIGGGYRDPAAAGRRFLENFRRLPGNLARRLALENDDRSFNAEEVLSICQESGCPMVLDAHHDRILPSRRSLAELLPEVFATWWAEEPKLHFSSPRSSQEPRSHAGYLETDAFLAFLRIVSRPGRDLDIMLEAKAKDLALLKLSEELGRHPGIGRVGTGEFEVS